MKEKSICVVPVPQGVGGMVSFYHLFVRELEKKGIKTVSSINHHSDYQSILIIGGTRHLAALYKEKKRKIRIVQRLDGFNWIHTKKWGGVQHYIKSEIGNAILRFIRSDFATSLVYQSEFAKNWWNNTFGESKLKHTVIYNGVDCHFFSPNGEKYYIDNNDAIRLLMVEGNLYGGYECGLNSGIDLAFGLEKAIHKPVQLIVVGKVDQKIKEYWNQNSKIGIKWLGVLPREKIPSVMRSAHLFFAADIHPACPNTVLEALSCGLPVISFDTGALRELVTNKSGEIVPYGANAWKLEPPNNSPLIQAAAKVLENLDEYRQNARSHCIEKFNIEKTINQYLEVLL